MVGVRAEQVQYGEVEMQRHLSNVFDVHCWVLAKSEQKKTSIMMPIYFLIYNHLIIKLRKFKFMIL